jgi:hypothetical protein
MAAAEQKKNYAVVKDFKGLNTKNNRTVIGDGEFSWLENIQPIGYGNLKITPGNQQLANVAFTANVSFQGSVNISNNEYVLAFQDDGSAQYVNITTGAQGNIAPANTFSNADVMITQWRNERALIIDPVKGYKTWDGTNLLSIGSINTITINNGGSGYLTSNTAVTFGAPNEANGVQATGTVVVVANAVSEVIVTEAGTGYTTAPTVTITGAGTNANVTCTILNQSGSDIATFSGRTWIAQDRTVYYTATDTYNDFINLTAGFITLSDSTLRTEITRILSANNFLYVFGEDSINVFSDVRVDSTLGTTLFTNTNVSASVGSKLKHAIFPYFRSVLFMNEYGVYALVGATTTKISDPLDGVFPVINFDEFISGGQCLINNILCAVFNFKFNDDGTERWIQAAFFERKWFFTNQLTDCYFVVPAFKDGFLNLYGTSGKDLYQFYEDVLNPVDMILETALLPMGDPIRDKQALKIGIEATLGGEPIIFDAYVDSENQQSPAIEFSNAIIWLNNVGSPISWSNNASLLIGWAAANSSGGGYYLYKKDAKMFGKYLGITLEGSVTPFTINGFEFEHELRARF